MSHNNYVEVSFNNIYWNIQAFPDAEDKTDKKLIRLEWGWGAGLTDKERVEAENDFSPACYGSVTTTTDMAKMLVMKLIEIINEQEK